MSRNQKSHASTTLSMLPPGPPDPGLLVALAMLARSLEAAKLDTVLISQPSTLSVVKVPTPEWADPTCRAWGKLLHNGRRHADPVHGEVFEADAWIAVVCSLASGNPAGQMTHMRLTRLRQCLWNGLTVAGFAADPATSLPPFVIRRARHSISLIGPTAAEHPLCGPAYDRRVSGSKHHRHRGVAYLASDAQVGTQAPPDA